MTCGDDLDEGEIGIIVTIILAVLKGVRVLSKLFKKRKRKHAPDVPRKEEGQEEPP